MTRALLTERLAAVQAEIEKKLHVREALTAHLNALRGREAELTELLAMPEESQ